MPSNSGVSRRLGLAVAILVAVLFVIVFVADYLVVPASKSSAEAILLAADPVLGALTAVLLLLGFALFAYAAYWSFSIRRALSVPLYRRLALGIGLIALNEALVDPINHLLVGALGTSYLAIFLIVGAYLYIIWFYWIDIALQAGRRSDPLLRDTFRWKSMRKIAWSVLTVFMAIPVVITSYYSLAHDWAFLDKIFSSSGSLSYPLDLYLNLYVWIFAAFIGAALVLTGRRSGDKGLHRQLEWFGAFLLMGILASAAGQTNLFGSGALSGFVLGLSLTLQGWFIYKAARSLTPTSRIERIEVPAA